MTFAWRRCGAAGSPPEPLLPGPRHAIVDRMSRADANAGLAEHGDSTRPERLYEADREIPIEHIHDKQMAASKAAPEP